MKAIRILLQGSSKRFGKAIVSDDGNRCSFACVHYHDNAFGPECHLNPPANLPWFRIHDEKRTPLCLSRESLAAALSKGVK